MAVVLTDSAKESGQEITSDPEILDTRRWVGAGSRFGRLDVGGGCVAQLEGSVLRERKAE